MHTWANTVITNKGLALLAKLTQGNTLELLEAIVGAGYVTPGLLQKQEDVLDPKQVLSFRPAVYPEDGVCELTMDLTNDELDTGYEATQIGVFATDPDEGRILFFIAQSMQADRGTTVPSREAMPGYSAEWTFKLKYGQADGVTVTVDPAGKVSREEMEVYIRENTVSQTEMETYIQENTVSQTEMEEYLQEHAISREALETYINEKFVPITNEQIDAILAT